MFRQRIRTVGISMLGGNSGITGSYDLGIHSIRAVNEEDVSRPPCELPPLDRHVPNVSMTSGRERSFSRRRVAILLVDQTTSIFTSYVDTD